jgi:hypothetical protein
MWRIRYLFYKITGIRQWEKPSSIGSLRGWFLWAWNEYDDYLYNGIHGFRIMGFVFTCEQPVLNWLCWKLLPIFRLLNRRPERIR